MCLHQLIAVLTFAILAAPAPSALFAQDPDPEQPGQQQPQEQQRPAKPDLDQPVPPEQMAVARVMAQQGLKRLPDQLARQYSLTDEQKAAAGTILQNRWAAIPAAEQDSLIRATILARQLAVSRQATTEDWQRLARESMPAVEATVKMFNDSAADFERVLDDEQRAKFAENMVQFRQGMDLVTLRAKLVADGTVKLGPDGEPTDGTSWPSEAELPGRGGPDVSVVEEEVEEVGPDGTAIKVTIRRIRSTLPEEGRVAGDEKYWGAYVKGFIVKFGLDADQTKAVRDRLNEAVAKAREFRERMKAPLEQARAQTKDAEQAKDARAIELAHLNYDRLNESVVRIFRDLQRQLEGLLTDAQRRDQQVRGTLFAEPPKPPEQP